MSMEQLIIERFVDTLSADGTLTGVIPATAIDRSDGVPDTPQNRRIELNAIRLDSDDVWLSDGTLTRAWSGTVQVDVVLPRSTAYGSNNENPEHAGDMDTVLDRLDALIDNQSLSISGFGLSTMLIEGRGRGEASAEETRRYNLYRVNALTGSNRLLNGADITVQASDLGDRVILAFSERDETPLDTFTGWTECSESWTYGRRRRPITLLVASTNAAPLNIAAGTTLGDAVITRAGSSETVDLLVYAVRGVPVRAGESTIHYTELSCMVNP